jgi:endonuclease/exonuclease/phosphatase family metal-dependent hydrolase
MTAAGGTGDDPGRLRVATFNIRHGAPPDGRVSLAGLAGTCEELDVDVLGLQEVDKRRVRSGLRDEARVVARRLGACHVYGTALRRHGLGCYGNALVVRGTLADVEVRELPGVRQRRVAILARATVRGIGVSLAVVHLQHVPKDQQDLPDEAPEQLRAAIGWLHDRPLPRVLLGDLNLQPPRAEPILTGAGFQIAPTGPTFPADAPRLRLDYVAVQGGAVESARVGRVPPVSDHRPVVAVVRIDQSLR